jgi:hypothetical protein
VGDDFAMNDDEMEIIWAAAIAAAVIAIFALHFCA